MGDGDELYAAYGDRSNPLLAYVWPDGSLHPLMPGKRPDHGQARWESRGQAKWSLQEGTTGFLWRWNSDVLDLRPEYRDTESGSNALASTPVNRSGAYGAGTAMRLIIWSHSGTNFCDIAGMSANYWEAVNDQPPAHMTNQAVPGVLESTMFRVSRPTDVSDLLLEGGQTANVGGQAFRGATMLNWSPPGEGIRFWQVWLEITINKDTIDFNPDAFGINWQASAY